MSTTSHAPSTIPHAFAGTVTPSRVVSVSPIELPAPGRPVDLQVEVSAPVTGDGLPVVLLSHGHGPSHHLSSLHGFGWSAGLVLPANSILVFAR